MPHIVVIGGGISGLSAALALQDRDVQVTVLEASERFGGPIQTVRTADLILDTGPDSFLSSKAGGIQLAERLGIADRLINTRPDGGGTFILHGGKLEPLPEGITLLVPTQFQQIAESPLLDSAGKLRLMADYLIPARSSAEDESVASFMNRRVGQQAFENLAEPLLTGIFAGDATRLSILSTFPRLRDVERRHGGLIRGALAQRRAAGSGSRVTKHSPFVSFANGLGEIIEGLEAALDRSELRRRTAAQSIEPRGDGYEIALADGSTVGCDAAVFATPAYVTAQLLENHSPQVSAELREIPYVSSATVSMAFRDEDVAGKQVGRGFVVPRVEGRALTAVTWSSNKFAGRAPEGVTLLRGFTGRAGQEENAYLPEDQLIELLRSDIAAITGITAEPLMAQVFRWPKAMPQYIVGHQARLGGIDDLLADHPALALTGNAYRGVGIPDCITNASAEANRLLSRLASTAPTRGSYSTSE